MKIGLLSLILLCGLISNAMNELKREPKRVVVVGQTGVGKSTLINFLVQQPEICPTSMGSQSQTKDIQQVKFSYKEEEIIFIDTPGLEDSSGKEEEMQLKIVNFLAKEGLLAAVIIVINNDRGNGIEYYKKFFAPLLKKNQVIIVRTNLYDMFYEEENYIEKYKENFLIEHCNIYFINSKRPKNKRLFEGKLKPNNYFTSLLENRTQNKTFECINVYDYSDYIRNFILDDILKFEPIDLTKYDDYPLLSHLHGYRTLYILSLLDIVNESYKTMLDVRDRYNGKNINKDQEIVMVYEKYSKFLESLKNLEKLINFKQQDEIDQKKEEVEKCLKDLAEHEKFIADLLPDKYKKIKENFLFLMKGTYKLEDLERAFNLVKSNLGLKK